MANTVDGIPLPAELLTYADALAGYVKRVYSTQGLNAPSELPSAGNPSTNAASADYARLLIEGGSVTIAGATTVYPALGNNRLLTSNILTALNGLVQANRWDVALSVYGRSLISDLNTAISQNIPAGRVWPSGSTLQALTAHLIRLNGVGSPMASLPPAPTVTAVNNAAGGLPTGAGARLRIAIVGAASYQESLPSAVVAPTALAGAQNAYNLTWASGTIPATATKIAVYRQLVGAGAGDPYYWDQDYTVTGGAAYSSLTIPVLKSDIALNSRWRPAAWMSCMMAPEFAAFYALANSVLLSRSQGGLIGLLPLTAAGMLDPSVVFAGASNGFVGYGNTPVSAIYATKVFGGAYTQGTRSDANSASSAIQGFAGALVLQARVTSALAATTAMTLSDYDYYSSLTNYGVTRNSVTNGVADGLGGTTIVGSAFSGTGVGSLATFTGPNDSNGNPVLLRKVNAVTGGPASGTVVLEGQSPRVY